MKPLLPALALAALLLPSPAPGGEGEGAVPAYALPEGMSRGEGLPPALEAAVARAVRDVTRPGAPWAAAEGWRVLAGVGLRSAPAAVAALPEADWFGRALLLRALGSMEEPALEPLLVQAAADPAWAVRAAAAEGLGMAAGAPSAQVLPGLLRDEAWRVRVAAVEGVRRRALRGTFPRESAAAEILPLARDPDEDVRRAAWLALADLREPRARDALLDALRALGERLQGRDDDAAPDPEQSTAVRLLRGVAEGIGEDAELDGILRGLGATPTHPLAGAALREWFRRAGPRGAGDAGAMADLVTAFLEGGADADSRAAAEEALLDLGEPAAAALLARIAVAERPRMVRPDRETVSLREVLRLVLRLRGRAAAATLEGILRDGSLSPLLRMHAAELGRRTCPAALGPAFRDLLASREGSAGLGAQLLKGAAASGGEDLRDLLARHLVLSGKDEPPRHLRAAAAEVLDQRPDLRDPAAIRRALAAETDGDILARLLPLLAAAEGEGSLDALERFLGDPRLRVRLAAARGLADLRGERAVAVLRERIAAEDGGDDRLPGHYSPGPGEPVDPRAAEAKEREIAAVREANAGTVRTALLSSLRFAAGEGAGALLAQFLAHPDPEVRRAAAANLLTIGDPAAAPALAARVPEEGDPGLRTGLLLALAALGGPGADAAFEAFLAAGDPDLRTEALEALGSPKSRVRAPAGLRALLADPDADAYERLAALHALGRAADPALTPDLLAFIARAPSEEERRGALAALGLSRDPSCVEAVAALLPRGPLPAPDSDALDTANQAVETLGELRCPRAAPFLAALLRRTLPGALTPGGGRAAARDRQVAALAVAALGRCGGEEALAALVEAAFHPGFSRAAETATSNPLRPAIPRREGERWRPELPGEVGPLAQVLAEALARWKDGPLAAALERRFGELGTDGRLFAVGEEWLTWLGTRLAEPHPKTPPRPRWWAKVLLARQVLANPPRLSEADAAAAQALWSHGSTLTMDYAAARRDLARWRDGTALHEPLRYERDRRLFAGLDATAAVGEGLRARSPGVDASGMAAAFEESGREDAVARLGVEILVDLGVFLPDAVALGEKAVASDGGYWPNLRSLGEARFAAGDAEGAAEMFLLALEEAEGGNGRGEMQRGTAWTRLHLGKALEACGERAGALRRLGEAAALSDVVFDWIERDRALEELRKDLRYPEAMARAREVFGE